MTEGIGYNPESEPRSHDDLSHLLEILKSKGSEPQNDSDEGENATRTREHSSDESPFTAQAREYSQKYADLQAQGLSASEVLRTLVTEEKALREAQTEIVQQWIAEIDPDLTEYVSTLKGIEPSDLGIDTQTFRTFSEMVPQLVRGMLIQNGRLRHDIARGLRGLPWSVLAKMPDPEPGSRLAEGLKTTLHAATQGTYHGEELIGKTVEDLRQIGYTVPSLWEGTVQITAVNKAGFMPNTIDTVPIKVEPQLEPQITTS